MPLKMGVTRERLPGERRVAIVPEVAKKFQSLGVEVCLEAGAGAGSHFADADYVGATIVAESAATCAGATIILRVAPPSEAEILEMPEGATLIGALQPYQSRERLDALNRRKITAFAMELLPRISRAQSMDVLSSQASVAGYQVALIAAGHSPKFFPMLTTAAGTIRPARVFVVGAGVAGLQAIATCKRLGAIVEAYDVRAAAREQIESLGAKFVDTGVSADGAGGYARELTAEEKAQQQEKLAKAVAGADVVITTAAIPGKRAPIIVTADMVRRMKAGAVIVDLAAESGGNCELTHAAETIVESDVTIVGPTHIPSRQPTHASEMYAKNLYNFISPFIKDGKLEIDWNDEIIAGTLLARDGETRHEGVRKALGGA